MSLCRAIGESGALIPVTAERAFLAALDSSCRTPIAALAKVDNDHLVLEGLVARPDGSSVVRMRREGDVASAALLGNDMGERIKGNMPPDFFIAAELQR